MQAGETLRIVIIGLSITSSWGNGHATTFRSLVAGLAERGHDVLFLERDKPWYAEHRDLPAPPFGRCALYADLAGLERHAAAVGDADLVIVGSYVPDGVEVCRWALGRACGVTAFYDIDTPVTLTALEGSGSDYITRELIPRFDLYLSFTGGPTLDTLERRYGARRARALYCSVDPQSCRPDPRAAHRWDLGYLGTYSADRQPTLERLLLQPARGRPARRFVVAGPQYPDRVDWPDNCERIEHAPPRTHRRFYASQRFTLNVTRADMVRRGYSPSVRLFEAAACGTPIVSDAWPGLETLFRPGKEIFVARDTADVLALLEQTTEAERREVAERARARVLAAHTGEHRAAELEAYARDVLRERAAA